MKHEIVLLCLFFWWCSSFVFDEGIFINNYKYLFIFKPHHEAYAFWSIWITYFVAASFSFIRLFSLVFFSRIFASLAYVCWICEFFLYSKKKGKSHLNNCFKSFRFSLFWFDFECVERNSLDMLPYFSWNSIIFAFFKLTTLKRSHTW